MGASGTSSATGGAAGGVVSGARSSSFSSGASSDTLSSGFSVESMPLSGETSVEIDESSASPALGSDVTGLASTSPGTIVAAATTPATTSAAEPAPTSAPMPVMAPPDVPPAPPAPPAADVPSTPTGRPTTPSPATTPPDTTPDGMAATAIAFVPPLCSRAAYPAAPLTPSTSGRRTSARRLETSFASPATIRQRAHSSRWASTRLRSRVLRFPRECAPRCSMVQWHSESAPVLRRCACTHASRRPSRARKASCDTAPAFIPRSGPTSPGFICSISVYQSTSCQRVGRLRNA